MNKFPKIVILFFRKWDKLCPFSIIILSGASLQTHCAEWVQQPLLPAAGNGDRQQEMGQGEIPLPHGRIKCG